MIQRLLYVFCFLFSAGIVFSQPKQRPVVKPAVPELKQLLSGAGLPYKMISDSIPVGLPAFQRNDLICPTEYKMS
jgi:hypothetical protein